MIVAAGLLVLVGLGLFVAGVLTGDTALYWACVGTCVVAAVLLVVARVRMTAGSPSASAAKEPVPAGAGRNTGEGAAFTKPEARAAGGATAASTATGTTGAGTTPGDAAQPAATSPATSPASADGAAAQAPAGEVDEGEPPVEEVEVTDLLLVVDLKDEVLVVDEHPRYHVTGCRHLTGRTTIPIPLDEARTDGFTPCGGCRPDATLAERVRVRKHSAGS